ncbi:hypothetical protein COCON_G00234010 [Conger conger]|uniref:Uncharacterized protein n=1 Tax=Conger conger TaxID=82655 RepID=A0A9Q1CUB2_CONCO|nr:hypothetical protein COCON_G00234010 [Conger conger]
MSLCLDEQDEATTSKISQVLGKEEAEKAPEKETSDDTTDAVIISGRRALPSTSSVCSMQTERSNPLDHPNLTTEPRDFRRPRSLPPASSVCSMQTERSNPLDHPNLMTQPRGRSGRRALPSTSSVRSMLTERSNPLDHPNLTTQPRDFRELSCDVCPEGRCRPVKFCLTCLAYYCEAHIRDHYMSEALQMHELEDVSTGSECQCEETLKYLVSVEMEQGERQSSEADAQSLQQNNWKPEGQYGRRPAGNTFQGEACLKRSFPVAGTSKCETHGGEAEGKRKMQSVRNIRKEEKKKREELEIKIRAEEQRKREEAEIKIREEERKKRRS